MSAIGNVNIVVGLALGGAILAVKSIERLANLSRKKRITITEPGTDYEQIIGDGAWSVTKAQFPQSARVREFEPRGM